jgi:hypothetical protein
MMTNSNPNLYSEWEPLVRVEGVLNVLDVPLTIAQFDHHIMYNFLGLGEIAEFMVLVNLLSRLEVAVGKGEKNLEVDYIDIRKGFKTAASVNLPDHLKVQGETPTKGALELLKRKSIITEWERNGKTYAISFYSSKMVQERLREILYDEFISEGFKRLNSSLDLRRFSTLEDAAHLDLLESLEGSLESYEALRKGFYDNIRLGAFASRLTFLSSKTNGAPRIPYINMLYTPLLKTPIKIEEDGILPGVKENSIFIEDHLKEQKEKLQTVLCKKEVRSVICRIFDRYIRSWRIHFLTWGLRMKSFVYFPQVEEGVEDVDRILVWCIVFPTKIPDRDHPDSENRFSMQDIKSEYTKCLELFDNAGWPLFGNSFYASVRLGKCLGGEQE